ncbi:MerR family transcriptional regulator [Rhodobacteraceae bacterium]|nr:MerR family transcriptional regulator [Paracoccaceae bacterium]
MVQKSREAFRTISEVAEWLDVPTHVLRFWESRFSQIKPVKRAGGRRYYRPSDMRVIGGVKTLLHDQGMTIRGVQKLFREEGIKHVSAFSPALKGEGIETEPELSQPKTIEAEALNATPAPAARNSRDAVPDPTIDPIGDMPSEDAEVEREAVPVFSRSSRTPTRPVVETVVKDDATAPSLEPESKPETVPPGPTIPATPDVPLMDPEDDAPEFAASPGIAARLLMADPAALEANRADVLQAAERLKALLATAH